MMRLAKRLGFHPSSSPPSHRHAADKWADRGQIRPDTFEGNELARPFDPVAVVDRVFRCSRGSLARQFHNTKKATGWPLFRNGGLKPGERARSESLLGQAGSRSGSLAGLELGIGFADDVNRALPLDDLAIGVAALGGGE